MKIITSEEAKKLNENFIKIKGKALDKIVEKETGKPKEKDAISSWFSLDELKEYIAYVEDQGKEKDINVNGLRIYFGSYSNNEKNKEKKGLSTVFLVPTQAKVGALQKDGLTRIEAPSDITDIDGMNSGGLGQPPSAIYPQ
ncbi:hypothetical protein SAMN06265371_102373 [Lutibacter agarilyticus]|uniref:Uncharacterized protein n=1 Tax=Lutibacter agarilyticus TaxID=1109740 RepID=A0A238W3B7_9FLAO|nr:hypothetical protein [Lutibacter agarilyticus]SNR40834.1 hypothetical protein SAMN06265371_102373 [Lutibacter agarilyticus]